MKISNIFSDIDLIRLNILSKTLIFKYIGYPAKRSLASNTTISDHLQKLLLRVSFDATCNLAANPCICKDVQLHILNSDNVIVRSELAKNTNLCEEFQIDLANAYHLLPKVTLARNTTICTKAQIILSKCPSYTVRTELAGNPNIDENIQLLLSSDDVRDVRLKLKHNDNVLKYIKDKIII